MYSLENEV